MQTAKEQWNEKRKHRGIIKAVFAAVLCLAVVCLGGCAAQAEAAEEKKETVYTPATSAEAATPAESGGYLAALYWRDTFYAAGTGGRIDRVAEDGTTTTLNTGVESDVLCLYGDDQRMLAGLQDGTLLLSTDGVNFENVLTGLFSPIQGITRFHDTYYLALENGYLLYSDDGTAWQATRKFTEEPIISITSNDNMLFAISAGGDMIRTTDGTNWRTSNFNEVYEAYYDPLELTCIKALGDSFFLLAHYADDDGEPFVALSASGDIWMQRALTEIAGLVDNDPFYLHLYDIGALDDQLVAAASDGQLVTISECAVCHTATQVAEEDLRAVAFSDDAILAVGDGFSCVLNDTEQMRQYAITADQTLELMKDGAILVDVRGQEDYQKGHIAGAINIPLDDLEELLPEQATPDDTVIFYCQVGTRSQAAVQKALEMGYPQVYTAGGIQDWPYDLAQE